MKKNEKTIEEWLETLPGGYRERALKNYYGLPVSHLSTAILEAFTWRDTPEGYEFWSAVDDWAFGEGELPPLPEEEI